ncbi:MAG TPA: DUF6491 family protein [Micropepsaceae bacterium]|nr:DUF6491 family protein [Micropepsaceae bacterium]
MRHLRPVTASLIAGLLLSPVVRAQPEQPDRVRACFFSRDFQQWRAPDASTIMIRVGVNRFYRLDLSAPCPTLQFPSTYLVNVFRGSDAVCGPLDWDIRVAQYPAGVTEQCIVKSMTQLTPEQVAAIPPRLRP